MMIVRISMMIMRWLWLMLIVSNSHQSPVPEPGLSWRQNLNYSETLQLMRRMVREHPGRASLVSIGKSARNQDIWLLRLSTETGESPKSKEDLYASYRKSRSELRPNVKLIGTIHGNEPLGKQLLLALADHLLGSNDPRIKRILDSTTIEMVPLLNPDGFGVAREGDCSGLRGAKRQWNGRENANGVDLNLDFPLAAAPDPNQMHLQPETLAAMSWFVQNPALVLGASVHTGLKVISYPYDTIRKPAPDDILFRALARDYVHRQTDPDQFRNGCQQLVQFPEGISAGYELDPDAMPAMNGSMADFSYSNTNSMDLNLYLACCKYPNSIELDGEWQRNRESLLNLVESAHWGIKGLIKDRETGTPLTAAIVSVLGFGRNVTSTDRGEYWRLLLPDVYTVTVSALGYQPLSKLITVNNSNFSSALRVDFELVPLNSDGSSPSSSAALEREEDDRSDTLPDFRTPTEFIHHDYKAMEKLLKDLNARYPHISRLYTIGQTVEGRELYVLEITDNPGQHELGEPEFKYVGNMHGNEVVGREMILLFAKLLLENYGHHSMVDWLVNNTRIHLMPSMNPDGYEQSTLGDCDSLIGRNNANNVDLNRNFPDQYKTFSENRVQQPETIAVMNWLRQYPFVLSANLHGGALVANYPFDGNNSTDQDYYNGTPDDKLFRHLASIYSQNHPHMHKGQCYRKCINNSLQNEHYENGIINGAYWYSLYGGMQDWNYLHTNCFEITVELGCQKYPLAKELPRLWRDNRRPMLAFVKQVHLGIKGVVWDSYTNGSLPDAEIAVNGSTHRVRSVRPYGDYWRLLLPGTYQVTVSRPGYSPETKIITVDNRAATWMDFHLQPMPSQQLSLSSKMGTEIRLIQFSVWLLALMSAAALAFCMGIFWCPGVIAIIVGKMRTGNAHFCDRFLSPISSSLSSSSWLKPPKPKTFYYSKLNAEDDSWRETTNDTDEYDLNHHRLP